MNKPGGIAMKKSIFLLALVFMAVGISCLPAKAEVITLDQAKALANANSRTLAQYQLNTQKADYQIDKLEQQQSVTGNILENMLDRYEEIQEQIAALKEAEGDHTQAISQLQQQLDELDESIDEKAESAAATSNDVEDSEETLDDAEVAEANYAKKLDYEVEKLYTSILQQVSSLETANLRQQAAEIELQMARTRLQLGTGTQSGVYEKAIRLSDQEKEIASIRQRIRTAKGTLNDILGRDYSADLELSDFVWTSSLDIPEYDTLLDQARSRYQALKNTGQAIEDAEEDLEDTDDYYSHMLLTLEIQEKKLALEDQKLQLSQSVDNLLYEVSLQQQTYKTAQLDCQQALQKYSWDKKRYELGQISKMTLLTSELEYINARNQQATENYALFLAEHQLQLAQKGIL